MYNIHTTSFKINVWVYIIDIEVNNISLHIPIAIEIFVHKASITTRCQIDDESQKWLIRAHK